MEPPVGETWAYRQFPGGSGRGEGGGDAGMGESGWPVYHHSKAWVSFGGVLGMLLEEGLRLSFCGSMAQHGVWHRHSTQCGFVGEDGRMKGSPQDVVKGKPGVAGMIKPLTRSKNLVTPLRRGGPAGLGAQRPQSHEAQHSAFGICPLVCAFSDKHP